MGIVYTLVNKVYYLSHNIFHDENLKKKLDIILSKIAIQLSSLTII